jgi:hypothetical protein
MSHPDDEVLVDLATGESVGAEVTAHVTTCPRCSSEVASLREVLSVVRDPRPELVPAPGHIWDAVAAEIRRGDSSATPSPAHAPEPSAEHSPAPPVDLAQRREARGRRRPPLGWVAGAAAAGLVVGVAGSQLLDGADPEPAAVTVASTTLDTLDTQQALGTADVVRHDGQVDLAVNTDPLAPPADGYLEVWLINEDLKRMVSVGVLRPGAADQTFAIPQELLDEGYTIVDISREGFDDAPEHSGDSVVRGSLAT